MQANVKKYFYIKLKYIYTIKYKFGCHLNLPYIMGQLMTDSPKPSLYYGPAHDGFNKPSLYYGPNVHYCKSVTDF
jgi:hypothetical protein